MQSADDHRAELRELNELSVARIKARFGQVEGRMDARIDIGLKTLDAEIDVGLKAREGKIDQRVGDLINWSFVFWCGAVVAAMLARG